jgi:adenosylcobinamide-GDP ribazoletransferase
VRLLREYLVAVQFFTRLPVTGALAEWTGYSPELLRASSAHFPGVGWLVGLAAGATFALLSLLLRGSPLTPVAAAVGCTIVTVLLTGAFHEDGLADVADGLGGSAQRDRALAIMKDSRLGTYGVIALVLALLAKTTLLAVLAGQSQAGVLLALFAAHAVSRFAPLLIVRSLPYVADADISKSKPLVDSLGARELSIALAWCAPPLLLALVVLGWVFALVPVLLAALAAWRMKRLFERRLGGFTGDALGATQQVCEIAFYLGASLAWGLA